MDPNTTGPGLGIALHASSPVPLYAQLFAALRRRILDGRCPEGMLLPSEADMALALGVSRITVKRAFDELAGRGMVHRQRGRGTEVLRAAIRPVVASIDGLVESHLVMGRDTAVELVDFAYEPASAEEAAALEVGIGTPVQRAVRVRRENGLPFSHITTWVPEAVGRHYDRAALATTPLLVLLGEAGAEPASADQVIGAEAATADVAERLGVPPGAALLRISRVSRDRTGRPVEHAVVLYNPARYQYRMSFDHAAAGP